MKGWVGHVLKGQPKNHANHHSIFFCLQLHVALTSASNVSLDSFTLLLVNVVYMYVLNMPFMFVQNNSSTIILKTVQVFNVT